MIVATDAPLLPQQCARIDEHAPLTFPLTMLSDVYITALFDAVVEGTEEAIVNAVLSATTTERDHDGGARRHRGARATGRATGPGAQERRDRGRLLTTRS